MHMLVTLTVITAAYMHNIARASGVCGKPEVAGNIVPVSEFSHKIGDSIRIKCANGYVRKAGTSNLLRCIQQNGGASWHSELPLKCIPDPKKTHVTTVEPSTLSTTEITATYHTTLHGTSLPTTATGHIALTTTNEVVTTKTRRTTSQPTLMSTTKETESITTATSYTSREFMTTTSAHTLSDSFTTTTGVNASVRNSTNSEGGNATEAYFNGSASSAKISGFTIMGLLCLLAPVLILLWCKHKNHRNQTVYHPDPDPYIPLPSSELRSVQRNKAAENYTVSVIDKNPGIPDGADTYEELLPQADS